MFTKVSALLVFFLIAFNYTSQSPASAGSYEMIKILEEDMIFFEALDKAGLDQKIYQEALIGQKKLRPKLDKQDIITIIDFSKSSKEERLWVINSNRKELLFQSLVSHGKNSGLEFANAFSNRPRSYQSSLGFYLTAETYEGKNGYSLRLDGVEEGINDNARDRAIVIHSADYVSREFISKYGRLGRSQGCPAIPKVNFNKIINIIAGKSCLFIHHSDKNYHEQSTLIKELD